MFFFFLNILNAINNYIFLNNYNNDISVIISEYSHEFIDLETRKRFIELSSETLLDLNILFIDYTNFLYYFNCSMNNNNNNKFIKYLNTKEIENLKFIDFKKYKDKVSDKRVIEFLNLGLNMFINTYAEIYFYLRCDITFSKKSKIKEYGWFKNVFNLDFFNEWGLYLIPSIFRVIGFVFEYNPNLSLFLTIFQALGFLLFLFIMIVRILIKRRIIKNKKEV